MKETKEKVKKDKKMCSAVKAIKKATDKKGGAMVHANYEVTE